MELPAPAARDPPRRRARRRARGGRAVRRRLPDPPAAARSAIEHPGPRPAVLLIDEIDRADDDFEAFLLELLAEASVTIPEIGTIRATHPPVVVLTSNRTRDLHDALKRRCLYHWIDYPSASARSRSCAGACRVPRSARGRGRVRRRAAARERRAEAAGHRRGDRLGSRRSGCSASSALDVAARADARFRAQVPRGPGAVSRRGLSSSCSRVTSSAARSRRQLDLPALAAAFGRACTTPGCRARRPLGRFAAALTLVRPGAPRLYWTARAVFVSDRAQVAMFDAVFCVALRRRWSRGSRRSRRPTARSSGRRPTSAATPPARLERRTARGRQRSAARATPARARRRGPRAPSVPMALASAEELLGSKRLRRARPARARGICDRLMAGWRWRRRCAARAARARTPRRAHRPAAHAARSLRTGGDPSAWRAAAAASSPRIVMLCDISGSMEPYARAYLQFLTCAAARRPTPRRSCSRRG